MATLGEIEQATREYSLARAVLREKVEALNDEIEKLKRQRLPLIRKLVEKAAEKEAALMAAVEESPELFRKPKTYTWHGIKVGYQKQKGKLTWDDDEKVVKLIKKHYPEDWELYVKVTEKPQKKTLEKLPGSELKKLGIEVKKDQDVVIVKSMDSEIDKLVSALLKGAEDTEEMREVA